MKGEAGKRIRAEYSVPEYAVLSVMKGEAGKRIREGHGWSSTNRAPNPQRASHPCPSKQIANQAYIRPCKQAGSAWGHLLKGLVQGQVREVHHLPRMG